MKKFKLYLLPFVCMILAFSFVSCEKDDDGVQSDNPLIGVWKGTEAGMYQSTDFITITFTSKGKMEAEGGDIYGFNWKFSGTYKVKKSDNVDSKWMISFAGYFEGDDEYYDDDVEYRNFYINGDELLIFFDGLEWILKRQ